MNSIHVMSGPEGNSFVFPRGLIKSRKTSRVEGKQNLLFSEGQDIVFCFITTETKKRKRINLDFDNFFAVGFC